MKERLTAERLLELRRIRAFAVSFNGPEKAFIPEELQAMVDEILERRQEGEDDYYDALERAAKSDE